MVLRVKIWIGSMLGLYERNSTSAFGVVLAKVPETSLKQGNLMIHFWYTIAPGNKSE